jgi:hypothetical protein
MVQPGARGVRWAPWSGLAFGSAHLWAFFNRRGVAIRQSQYLERVAASPHLKVPTFSSPFFWIPLILVGLALGIVLLALVVTRFR